MPASKSESANQTTHDCGTDYIPCSVKELERLERIEVAARAWLDAKNAERQALARLAKALGLRHDAR